jgi:XTP/dITP diphosphohydrolase
MERDPAPREVAEGIDREFGIVLNELVLATRNPDKAAELAALLADLGVEVRTLADIPDAPEVVEDGETCEANAVKKATVIARHTGLPTLADDTGLLVEALGGRPGVHAARYAGEQATYEDNWRKLLRELNGVPRERRRARFVTVAALAVPDESNRHGRGPGQVKVEVVEGVLDGLIAETPSGAHGFGYDPVFIVPELGRTLAQLTREEKNQVSHRSRALAKVKELLLRAS